MMARWWLFWGRVCLVRARRHEIRAFHLKKKAEEFFRRIVVEAGGDDGG
ncbi:hypothetical protein J2X53_002350 [Pseudorhodobacter sp. 4114]|nr:hypothetical protein [Pseudorhodobacter sp. 4114]